MGRISTVIAQLDPDDEVRVSAHETSKAYTLSIGPLRVIAPSLSDLERRLDDALHQVVCEKARLQVASMGVDEIYDAAVGL